MDLVRERRKRTPGGTKELVLKSKEKAHGSRGQDETGVGLIMTGLKRRT